MLSSCHSTKSNTSNATPQHRNTTVTQPAKPSTKPKITPPDAHGNILLETAYTWLGTPYLWGGNDKNGVDCSGFVLQVYLNATGIGLPRTSAQQAEWCAKADTDALEVGDLMFFTGKDSTKVSHVGMYVGEGKMIHSSSSRGVVIDRLDSNYWVTHLHHAGRVPALAKAKTTPQKTKETDPKPEPIKEKTPALAVKEAPVNQQITENQPLPDVSPTPQSVVKNAFSH